MIEIKQLIHGIETKEIIGDLEGMVNAIQFDSRMIVDKDVFVAISGTQVDGHLYIDKAIGLGAKYIVCQEMPDQKQEGITYIQCISSAKALGLMASMYYGKPSTQLKLVGITGTNGKTSTVTMLFNLFRQLGYSVGLLSTVENKIDDRIIPSTHTTPDPVSLNHLLKEMVDSGCEYAFMEVSSHSIDQERIAGLEFLGALFSNITHDHLDYHKTFDAYIKAKKKFFDDLPKSAFALVNGDDKNGMVMLQNTKAKQLTYALRKPADYKAQILENQFDGLHLILDNYEIWVPLVGTFNAYNLLSVYSIARELGADAMETLSILSTIKTAEGRFEYLRSTTGKFAIVDYAHTPDALKNVLSTLQEIRNGNEQLITVVGAGGDRDASKRPEMAKIAAQLSTRLILTSDNPRSEDPEAILMDMQAGLSITDKNKALQITDRREAIRTACALAQPGDIVLVAGKGHEKYQDIKGVKHPFDDKEIINECFKN